MNVAATLCPTDWKWDFHMTTVSWLLQKTVSSQSYQRHHIRQWHSCADIQWERLSFTHFLFWVCCCVISLWHWPFTDTDMKVPLIKKNSIYFWPTSHYKNSFGKDKYSYSFTKPAFSAVPGEVTVDVSQDLHEVRMDRGEANAGSLPHVDGALLRQVHVVEVDELNLGLLLWPEWTQNWRADTSKNH